MIFLRLFNICLYSGPKNSLNRGIDNILSILETIDNNKIVVNIIGDYLPKSKIKFKVNRYNLMVEKDLFEFLITQHIYIDNLKHSSFSLMAGESMMLGVLVIVSDETGISEFISDGQNGFKYKQGSFHLIRNIIDDICKGKYKLNQISENAIYTAKNFGWTKISENYFNLYTDVITNK